MVSLGRVGNVGEEVLLLRHIASMMGYSHALVSVLETQY
jgi:hypothetical protein